MANFNVREIAIFSHLQWLKNIRQHYVAKTPLEKWKFIRKIHWFLLRIVGVQFMDSNYKINICASIPIYLQINYYVLLVYTLFHYRNEPLKALKATPHLGFYVPGFILLIIVFTPRLCYRARFVYEYAAKNIYANSNISPKNYKVCDKMAIDLLFSVVRVTLLQLLSLALLTFVSLFKTFFTDDKELMVPVILPFIDPGTRNGFYVNFASQLPILCFAAFIVVGSELVSCIIGNSVKVLAHVTKNNLIELSDLLQKDKRFTRKHMIRYRNITLQILDFHGLIRDISDLLYWKLFVHPIVALYSISIAIFLYLIGNWLAGIGGAACLYIQLLILCDIGETVNDANLVILDGLNQFSFNLLPPKKREMFGMLMHRMQTGCKIKMGPLTELNYEAATKFTKMIYTYVMAMQRTMNE